ncbi:hypothetical protein [Natronobeatus ordinarius]|nr:hypothetical protein [Natronobeatus ordinarius]
MSRRTLTVGGYSDLEPADGQRTTTGGLQAEQAECLGVVRESGTLS